jgi:hypothetical protein
MIFWTLVVAFFALASAYHTPTDQDYGALYTPNTTDPVTRGKPFTVTWDSSQHATKGYTVSLVLCKGPSTNCVANKKAIVSGIPAAKEKYVWNVPCNLRPGKKDTANGNGMLIIVDQDGSFQYSTQFSVLKGNVCS